MTITEMLVMDFQPKVHLSLTSKINNLPIIAFILFYYRQYIMPNKLASTKKFNQNDDPLQLKAVDLILYKIPGKMLGRTSDS